MPWSIDATTIMEFGFILVSMCCKTIIKSKVSAYISVYIRSHTLKPKFQR